MVQPYLLQLKMSTLQVSPLPFKSRSSGSQLSLPVKPEVDLLLVLLSLSVNDLRLQMLPVNLENPIKMPMSLQYW